MRAFFILLCRMIHSLIHYNMEAKEERLNTIKTLALVAGFDLAVLAIIVAINGFNALM